MKTRLKQSENWFVQLRLLDVELTSVYCGLDYEFANIRCIKNSGEEVVFDCHRDRLWQLAMELGKLFANEHWSLVGITLEPADATAEQANSKPLYSLVDFYHHFVTPWMADAILDRQLSCYTQPLVSAQRLNQVVAQEYFLQLEDQDRESVHARDLFSFAQQYGLHENLHWATVENCFTHCFEQAPGRKALVSVDPCNFYRPEYLWTEILEALAENAYDGNPVVFEISMNAAYDPRMVGQFANRIRQYGFQLALNEWGQPNNSNLSLNLVRPKYVKISRELTKRAPSDPSCQKLVAGMVNTAKDLEMLVIAEGIENQEERDCAIESGFDWLQGNHLGEPVVAHPSHTSSGLFLQARSLQVENRTLFGRCQ